MYWSPARVLPRVTEARNCANPPNDPKQGPTWSPQGNSEPSNLTQSKVPRASRAKKRGATPSQHLPVDPHPSLPVTRGPFFLKALSSISSNLNPKTRTCPKARRPRASHDSDSDPANLNLNLRVTGRASGEGRRGGSEGQPGYSLRKKVDKDGEGPGVLTSAACQWALVSTLG